MPQPQPKPAPAGETKSETVIAAPVEAVTSAADITGAKITGASEPTPAPAPLLNNQPQPLASAAAAQEAMEANQREYQAREQARRQNLAEQSKVGGDVNWDAAKAAGDATAQRERERRLSKRRPGVYVRSQVKLLNEVGTPMECPEGMRIPDEMLRNIPDLKRLCDIGVLDDLR
ncbi:MAG: hypothetical protein ACOY0T_37525 [Myxococcota bacterium]